jgi:hypothetical protein
MGLVSPADSLSETLARCLRVMEPGCPLTGLLICDDRSTSNPLRLTVVRYSARRSPDPPSKAPR